ncbi:MAG: GTP-binding protein [Gammaproteobacteria bacterium]|nr:GTP-binding protein [Gammaproteobacteria bacterium]MCB1922442.1 GTP-binding protein [Gammaproteobacteria bacterium]
MAARIVVNLVTGFLGTGKTTTIRHLLHTHPDNERWAVLVNEFGEVGVDGALLDDTGVAVQEVAGGCLCCVAAPAFTTGLNRLIRRHRPDRILIEPSGLGHPAQVLETLAGPLYADVLELRATLCVMDARHLSSVRHRTHPTFIDQIHLADVLVANKSDLYTDEDRATFETFALSLMPPKDKLGMVVQGRVEPAWLDVRGTGNRRAAFPEAHAFLVEAAPGSAHSAADAPWIVIEGAADGYRRASWTIRQSKPWPLEGLRQALAALDVERVKGVVSTDNGWVTINDADWRPAHAPEDHHSRLVVIDREPIATDTLDGQLRTLDVGRNLD